MEAGLASCSLSQLLTLRVPVVAPPCFMAVEARRKEAALLHWRPFLHSEGDHLTLVNVYNAFVERRCPLLPQLRPSPAGLQAPG